MANNCFYDMHVKGKPADVDKFKEMLTDYDLPKHFFRVFEAYEYDRSDNPDGTVTAMISGDCAWSVAACMTKDNPLTYCSTFDDGTSLAEQSAELDLDIEVYAEETGMCFAEHYLYKKGEEKANEETRLDLYQFEPSDWDAWENRTPEAMAEFAEFKDDWDLPNITPDDVDPDCGDVRIGGFEVLWHV